MSQELHYTSVPRGLKPGGRGFCSVGMTPHMPAPLVDRLEALSGYQPVFPPHDPSAALNPVVFSHLRLTISGKVVNVLSRIGPAGLDYSGRPNKYAHHVVLEGTERSEAGPAWLLSQPSFMEGAWEGEPREIPAGRTPPQGDHQPGVATAWRSLVGDGGWAGLLAETFLTDPRRTVFLVFRPGMDLLPLFVEALALLPFSRRWEVDFSTYFSPLPQGITCAWRGVLDGSDEAKNARRLPNAVFFDLCHLLGRAEGDALVHLARTGERIAQGPGTTTIPTGSGRHIPRMPHEPGAPAAVRAGHVIPSKPQTATGGYDLAPEIGETCPRPRIFWGA
jgi:GTPase-associated protein 1, N-terminal domain type 2/GTPase-associated protein 1, middle domain